MVAMRCRVALAVSLVLALGGCTKEKPRMPSACIDTDRAGYERALTAAPQPVQLPGGVSISTCTKRVRTDAELQNLGTVMHGVAEELAVRARAGDAQAATALGYLTAAVAVGAAESNGIAAELARRIENTGVGVRDAGAEVERALAAGQAAGARRG
jgi:hypothetical protein